MDKHTNRAQICIAYARKLRRLSCSFPLIFTILLVFFYFKFQHRYVSRSDPVSWSKPFALGSIRNYTSGTIENTHSTYRLNFSSKADSYVSPDVLNDNETDVILIWTAFYQKTYLYESIEGMSRHVYSPDRPIHRPAFCEHLYPNCVITSFRKYLHRSNMVIFHYPDLNAADFPASRTPDQIWTLYTTESPKNVVILPRPIMIDFNATSLYHSQSDMPIPYGETYRFRNDDYVLQLEDKKYPIVELMTKCSNSSLKDKYVEQLRKNISVEIFGSCPGSDQHFCQDTPSAECPAKLYSEYYFYLAFEDSLCDEYATKIFMLLQHDIVPIVYGAASYASILPPKSFIDASKYKPADLAIYLKKLIADQMAYEEYFDWKRDYKTQVYDRANDYFHCEACRYAQRWRRGELERKSMTMGQINDWWKGTCRPENKILLVDSKDSKNSQ